MSTHNYCHKISAQPGRQRCPVPAIRYSRGDVLPRGQIVGLPCISGVDAWVLRNRNSRTVSGQE